MKEEKIQKLLLCEECPSLLPRSDWMNKRTDKKESSFYSNATKLGWNVLKQSLAYNKGGHSDISQLKKFLNENLLMPCSSAKGYFSRC